jgi:chromosome segregation ATPase
MTSINIDLPDEILAEVSRLAQEFNVPRAEILRRAVGALAKEQSLLADLNRLREVCAEMEAARKDLAVLLEEQKAQYAEKSRELTELKQRAVTGEEENKRTLDALDMLRQELAARETEKGKLAARLAATRRRLDKLGHTLAERTYLAIRSLEVERLRERFEKSIARMLEAEKRGQASEGAASRLAGQSARLSARLRGAEAKRAALAEQCALQKMETSKRERDIGQLRKELEAARSELKTLIKLLGGARAAVNP